MKKLKLTIVICLLILFSSISVFADYNAYVYTPMSSAVPVVVGTYELSAAEIQSYNNYVYTNYPSATLMYNASRKYNCHSYAWYYTNTANTCWMNNPSAYTTDGSYVQIYSPITGCRVTYNYTTHSAVYMGNGVCVSKWGKLGVVRHATTYSPYSGTLRYYK